MREIATAVPQGRLAPAPSASYTLQRPPLGFPIFPISLLPISKGLRVRGLVTQAGQSHFLGDFLRPAVSRGRCSELREDAQGSQGQGRTHPTGGTTRDSRAQVPTGVINQSSRAFPLTSKFGKAEEVSRHSQVCTGTADPIANPSRHLSALERGAPSRKEDAGTCLLHAIPFPSLLGSLLSASRQGLLGHVGLTCTGWC